LRFLELLLVRHRRARMPSRAAAALPPSVSARAGTSQPAAHRRRRHARWARRAVHRAAAAAVAGDATAEAVAAATADADADAIAAAAAGAAAVRRSDRQRGRGRATVRAAAAVPHSVNAHAGTGRSVYAATGSFHSVAVGQLLCETVSCWSCWSFDSTVCATAHFLGRAAWQTEQLRESERALLALINLTLTPRGKPLVRGGAGT